MQPYRDITDEEWDRVVHLLPELKPRKESRGRPLTNTRSVLNGVLWVLFSGASWATLPRKYPSYQTCHRRFKAWHDRGTLRKIAEQLFGASSESFYAIITARMRRPPQHPIRLARAAARAVGPVVAPATAPVAAPVAAPVTAPAAAPVAAPGPSAVTPDNAMVIVAAGAVACVRHRISSRFSTQNHLADTSGANKFGTPEHGMVRSANTVALMPSSVPRCRFVALTQPAL